ncbi:MAG: hypothetical protein AAGA85_13490 [Bacteroidota bacterium]
MKKIFILSLFLGALFQAQAQYSQYLLPPIDEEMIGMARDFYVVTNNDDTLRGDRLPGATMIDGQLRSFTLRTHDKLKVKFKAHEVKLLAVGMNEFLKVNTAMSAPNILRAIEMDWNEIANREWAYFEQVPLPRKQEKSALMQLLNSGFDSKVKVYVRPNSNETADSSINGVQLSGGEDTSYIVLQDGVSTIYRKRKYKTEALTKLYKNCEVFAKNYTGEKMKWQDFGEHVLIYDKLCGDNEPK